MLTKDYALANSHIGLSAIPTMAPKQNVNLGEVLAKGFENWGVAKDKEAEKKRTQDLIDALTEAHPEDAAQIASDPQAYAKMLQDNATAEREQQWKMDVLDKQFQNSIALQDRQHANAVGLARLGDSLRNQAANEEISKRRDALTKLYEDGKITEEGYQKGLAMMDLGEKLSGIVYGGGNGGENPYGLSEDAMKEYQKETAKNIVKAENDYNSTKGVVQAARNSTQRISSLIEEDPSIVGTYSGWSEKLKKITGGDSEWLKKRGEVVGALTQAGNFLIKQANDSGVTGINSLSEVERIIKGLTPNASAAQIQGAIKNINALADDLERISTKNLSRYRKGASAPTDEDAWGGI